MFYFIIDSGYLTFVHDKNKFARISSKLSTMISQAIIFIETL